MDNQEFAALRGRAQGGDPEAQTILGKALLDGPALPRAAYTGARFIAKAANTGHAEALATQAVLVAGGLARRANFNRALDLLQFSAERGWAPAQEQLRFLAGRDSKDFAALRGGIDIAKLLRPPEPKRVHEKPRLFTVQGLFTKAECDRLIAKAKPKLKRDGVYDSRTRQPTEVASNANSRAQFSFADIDLPFMVLHARMAMLLGLPSHHFEPTSVLHYAPGQELKSHVDYLSMDRPDHAADIQLRGQRVVTLLVDLNDGYGAGETSFPKLKYTYKGKTGDGVLFGNVDNKGTPEPLAEYAALPPKNKEKWVLSQWVRSRPPAVQLHGVRDQAGQKPS